jgi:hypothetical protein
MSAPYRVWDTRTSLGVMRDVEPAPSYWTQMFSRQINSTDEYIDFEKLPVVGRKLAPFVKPLGTGKPIYADQSTAYRFRPAYVKVKDAVDSTRPLAKLPGVDRAMLDDSPMSVMQRREALKAAMTAQHIQAIQRRWEWLAARAVIDGAVTISGEEYPSAQVDFLRPSNHTVVKTSGQRWGDSGISILDDIQTWADRMFDAPFGGFPTRMTIGTKVWTVLREAFRDGGELYGHMDMNIRGSRADGERGLIDSGRIVKVGELAIGGGSGAMIEIILYRDTYQNELGVETPFMTDTDIVLTASAERIMGFRCFGAIIDPYAQYQSVDIFPRNWMETGDPAVEYLLHQSAPLMVPVNPACTLRATVVAP